MMLTRRAPLAAPSVRLERGGRVARVVLAAAFVLGCYRLGRADEERAATRASKQSVEELVRRYRLRHGGRCPRDLAAVARDCSRAELPRDGWGNAFALRCPSPRDQHDFDVLSAGPDHVSGGLDAVD